MQEQGDAKASRIDGILSNLEALPMIHTVYVDNDINIPTHSAVAIVVARNAIERERSYVRTCPSLKVLHEETVEKGDEGPRKKGNTRSNQRTLETYARRDG